MGEFLKKQWAVLIVAIVFVGIICYVSADSITSKLPSKKSNGKDVVFAINGENYTADDLYDEMYESSGVSALFTELQIAVVDQAVETTDDLTSEAESQAAYIKSYYESTYGDDGDAYLLSDLNSMGYTSIDQLTDYFLTYYKSQQFSEDYLNEKLDEIFPEYQAKKEPCIVSHILVAMDDPTNPTEEELAKVAEIDAQLASGASFAEVAETYSDDTSSATNGGLLGFADADTSYVTEFMATMLAAEVGEPTEWFASTYGYHKILVNSRSLEDFKEYDDFYTAIEDYYPNLSAQGIMEYADKLGITYGSDDTKAALLEYIGLTDTEGEE